MQNLTIAVDAMGGDYGPPVTVPAVAQALSHYPQLTIKLFGKQEVILPLLKNLKIIDHPRLIFTHSPQTINNHDKPLLALRSKRASSMKMALDLVRVQEAQACVSAGNTGVLMAMAKVLLKLLPGIDRPALVSLIPTQKHQPTVLLDLGANSHCDEENLVQFAIMGSALAESALERTRPRVALLNIGEESSKGNDCIREAAQILRGIPEINYVGFIEGDKLFHGEVDVVVCEGFVGNIALKTAEGVAHIMISQIERKLQQNWVTRNIIPRIFPSLKRGYNQMNPDQYNGASLLGLRGIVIKSHGKADQAAFLYAIHQAVIEIQQQVPANITSKLESILIDK